MTTPHLTRDGKPVTCGMCLFVVYRARLTDPAWWHHARLVLCDVVVASVHDDGTVTGKLLGPKAKVKAGSDRVNINECYADLREAMKEYARQWQEIQAASRPRLDKTA